jgi:hypothetical protein
MAVLIPSLTLTGILSNNISQVIERISANGNVIIQAASAASQADGGEGNEGRDSAEVTDQGQDQNDTGEDQNGDEGDANIQLGGEMRPTDSPELTTSPTSQDIFSRGSPQVQHDTLGSGGSTTIARDCPDKGPIPPDCTLNPFPPTPPRCPDKGPIPPDCTLNPFPLLSGGETPGETNPTPAPTPPLGTPVFPNAGGILEEQPTTTPPPLFGRNTANIPLGGVFGQPTITATTPGPTPPLFGQIAPQGQVPPTAGEAAPLIDGGVAEQPTKCSVGNVWDPNLMICVPDLPPPRLCPDGSIPQSTGPGTQPECPSFEAEQPGTEE